VVDKLDYLLTLTELRILDAPDTSADYQRGRERERIEKAFPAIER
jgi:hypothetical protein